ncbi:hypothetical protein WME99_34545 [Sorangium sp. So ce136]|uniref:hypothetical protein n=1 Tax=Sorangium sp. So ce136 TaxID=3133284 RepID=UPI003F01902C
MERSHNPDLLVHMNVLGSDGWEAYMAVEVDGDRVHFFKRPVIVEPPYGAERLKNLVKF